MRTQLYIDGQWVDGNGTLDVIDPSDGSVIAKVATAGDAEIEAALAAAHRSLVPNAAKERIESFRAIGIFSGFS